MRERILDGYDPFVLPFMIGIVFILVYLLIAAIRVIMALPSADRKKLALSLINPKIMYNNIRDIICDCLLHIKIFKRNMLLGYMHASIAFGWFMLIVIGHIEVMLFVPQRNGLLYYPIFYRYFVAEQNHTLKGAVLFFLMDFFLLVVLSGIALAMYKRIRSRALGMRRTTKPCFADRVALYCLWSIFPLRLLAEGFTAGISGGGFLTKPTNMLFASFLGNDMNVLPTWWAYSTVFAIQQIYAYSNRAILHIHQKCRIENTPSAQGSCGGRDILMFKLRYLSGCLSNECAEKESPLFLCIFCKIPTEKQQEKNQ